MVQEWDWREVQVEVWKQNRLRALNMCYLTQKAVYQIPQAFLSALVFACRLLASELPTPPKHNYFLTSLLSCWLVPLSIWSLNLLLPPAPSNPIYVSKSVIPPGQKQSNYFYNYNSSYFGNGQVSCHWSIISV